MKLPRYSRHATGKARVRYKGRDVYLPGPYGSTESIAAYNRLCDHIRAEHATRTNGAVDGHVSIVCTITELLDAYMFHAAEYYRENSAELRHLQAVTRLLTLEHASLPASQFTPLHLEHVRQMMVEGHWKYESGKHAKPWRRTTVNQAVNRIRKIFRWGVSKMMVHPNTLAALESLDPLRVGRSPAKESEPVKPVAWDTVEITSPHLGPTVAAMVRFEWHTGMRPAEVCRMTPSGLDVSREASDGVWLYSPTKHKNRWRKKTRLIAVGPQGIAILKPRMPTALEAPFFPTPSGSTYSTTTYRQAIHRACDRAGIERWNPHQLRHSKATLVEQQFGREAAANALGDTIETTDIYADKNLCQMIEIARKTG